jgi:hypothetical protein
MEVQVPAGAADVSLRMADGMPEIAGAVLSALTAIGLILSLWYWGSRGRKQGDLNPREGNR